MPCFRGSARAGLAEARTVVQSSRPDKQLYRITSAGRTSLDAWLETVEPGSVDRFYLRLFVGGLTSPDVLIEHVDQFKLETEARLEELRAIEPTNSRSGNDFFHYFLLRHGIERAEQSIAWADWVLAELERQSGMRRALAAAAVLVVGVACTSSAAQPAADPAVAADVRKLAAEMERIHPNLFHSVSRAEFRGAVDELVARLPELERDQLLVELMRIVAMTGERDGHMGLFPLVSHARPLHLLPIRVWAFPEGMFVLASPERPDLVGTRLVAVEGRPVDEVAALVRPLVTRDNESSLILRLPEFMITGEILHGLGIAPDAARVRLIVERPNGERVDVTLATLAGARVLEPDPRCLGSAPAARRTDPALAAQPASNAVVRDISRADAPSTPSIRTPPSRRARSRRAWSDAPATRRCGASSSTCA